jgi:hypothetical protein
MARLYLRKEIPLCRSLSKSVAIGVRIGEDDVVPQLVIFGDKSEVRLDYEGWLKLRTYKQEIETFLKDNSPGIEKELNAKTGLKGHRAKSNSICFKQTTEKDNYIYVGAISIYRLYEMDMYLDRMFNNLMRSLPDISDVLKVVAARKRSGNSEIKDLFRSTTTSVDLGELLMELEHFPIAA